MNDMYKTLSNGVKIPSIGFGTYKLGDYDDTINSVKNAIKMGYRQIDTAAFYKNEEAVGLGIKESKINREDIFLVTKLWNDNHGYENTMKSFNDSIKKLGVDYLDLYLVHWPNKLNSETWRAFEDLYKMGKVKAIGACNFKEGHIEELKKTANIMPMVNQIEVHPYRTQKNIISYCKDNNIQVVAWGPIMRGRIFSDPIMIKLSDKYNKSIPQITLKWHLQNGIIPIPKSSNIERIKSNLDIFDFEISDEDMNLINKLNKDEHGSGVPENTTYLDFK